MKISIIFLLAFISLSAFAKKDSVIYPQVYNYGSSVQVQIWNTTDRNVSCSGSVNTLTESGARESDYYFEYISAHMTSFRTYYPRSSGDRIVSVYHTIYCN